MNGFKLPQIALLIAALAIGSVGTAADALARGGHGGGSGHGGNGGHGSVGQSHDGPAGGDRASSGRSAGPARDAVDRGRERALPNRNVGGHDDWRDYQSPNG